MADQSHKAAVVEFDHVTKRYDAPTTKTQGTQTPGAVNDLSVTVPAGKICILVGPSGCGKTTSLKMVNRLIEPTSGRILIDGVDASTRELTELRRSIGYVIQQVGLFPHMDVAGNIATVPRLLGWDRPRISRRVDELLELVGLDPEQDRGRYPAELSGGQRQRVGIARAMMQEPKLLLADEPTSSLDPKTSVEIMGLMKTLSEAHGFPVIINIHNVELARRFADRVIGMTGGRVVYDGSPEALTEEHLKQIYGGQDWLE